MGPIISICIPTYNRQKYLDECLKNICYQDGFGQMNIEIIISDNASTDGTKELVQQYKKHFSVIQYHRNDSNIGALSNMLKVTGMAKGEYIWLMGDDDIICDGGLGIIYNTFANNKHIDWVFINYYTYSEDTESIACKSLMATLVTKNSEVIGDTKIVFIDGNQFYSYLKQAPTFATSLIMRKSFYKNEDICLFHNNYYPHAGLCTLNIKNKKIVLISTLLIRGFIPKTNSWHKNGDYLFKAALDYLVMNYLVKNDPRCPFNENIYKIYKRDFLKKYVKLIILSKALGFQVREENILNLKLVFGEGFIFQIFLKPLLYLPFGNFLKKIIPSRYF